ncbi:MAG: hypothetical protein MJZ77_07795, partial [Bacteroidales bacterium]|nr:hypothetical protein [Bacteroidales bacterium]
EHICLLLSLVTHFFDKYYIMDEILFVKMGSMDVFLPVACCCKLARLKETNQKLLLNSVL